MMTITVADVLNDSLHESGWGKFRIYVFRDNDFVLYVGKTEHNVIDRLSEHLGLTYRSESHIGRLVKENVPEAHRWQIDLLTLDDCTSFVKRHFPTNKAIDVRLAEQAVILEFAPPLNHESNPHPRLLPRRYLTHKEARVKAVMEKVINAKK
ncbi:hypothetical protein ANRL3_03033 [Anaerolineae bacterium]|nr:hypothetical protein ANRL3_03033 [Anaerolineae bacterium]